MIQRIQTIFLLLSAGAFAALIPFPFATAAQTGQGIFLDSRYTILDNLFLAILTLVGILLALVCIFLFKKRKVQLKLGYLIILISLGIMVVAYVFFANQSPAMATAGIQEGPGLLMPVAAVVFTALANYFIGKDEKLVKSMDRLR